MSQQEAIRKENKIKRRKLKKAITTLLICIVFVLWSIYYILQSDLFNLKEIELEGNRVIETDEIIGSSNLVIDRSIFKYNLSDVQSYIESHPYIKSAQIKRKLPNKMIIHVKEREEYVIIPYMGSYIYLDKEKVAVKVTDSYLADHVAIVTGVEIQSFRLGNQIDVTDYEKLEIAFEILEYAKSTTIFDMISEINVSDERGIKLVTFDGTEVLLGEGTNPAYLMLALNEVLVQLYARNVKNAVVDMRYEGNISVRERSIGEDE